MNLPRMSKHTMYACAHMRISSGDCVKMTVDQLLLLLNQLEELIPLLKVLRKAVLAFSYAIHAAPCLIYI